MLRTDTVLPKYTMYTASVVSIRPIQQNGPEIHKMDAAFKQSPNILKELSVERSLM